MKKKIKSMASLSSLKSNDSLKMTLIKQNVQTFDLPNSHMLTCAGWGNLPGWTTYSQQLPLLLLASVLTRKNKYVGISNYTPKSKKGMSFTNGKNILTICKLTVICNYFYPFKAEKEQERLTVLISQNRKKQTLLL